MEISSILFIAAGFLMMYIGVVGVYSNFNKYLRCLQLKKDLEEGRISDEDAWKELDDIKNS